MLNCGSLQFPINTNMSMQL